MTLDAWRVAAEGVVEMDTMLLVDGTMRAKNCIAWPVVSKRKSTECAGMTSRGSCLV